MARKILWLVPLGFVALLFYAPLAKIISLGVAGNWLQTLLEPKTLEVIWLTLWLSGLSALLTIAISIPGAYVLYRRNFRGRDFVRALITVPFMLPTIVVAIGFTVFRDVHEIYKAIGLNFSDYPIYWIVAAHLFVNYSIGVRTIGGVWGNLDRSVEDAAELDGAGRFRTAWSIALPQLRGAIFSAAALVFLFSATSFGIVLVLGGGSVQTLETAIYLRSTQFLDLPGAASLVMVQTAITALAFLIGSSLAKGEVGLEMVEESSKAKGIDKRDRPASFLTFGLVFSLIAMPMVLIFARAFLVDGNLGLENFLLLGSQSTKDLLNISFAQAALNSLRNLAIAAVLAFSIGTLASWLLVRTKWKIMDLVFLMPLGVSAVVLGFGYLIFFDGSWFPLRSSWIVVPLAQSLIALPMVIRLVYPALVAIGKEPREQASIDGASSFQTFRFIESGMIRSVLLAAFSYAALISLGEFGAANFLAYGSQGTIPTLLYRLISRPGDQNYSMAMAVSAILIAVSFLVVWISSNGSRIRIRKVSA